MRCRVKWPTLHAVASQDPTGSGMCRCRVDGTVRARQQVFVGPGCLKRKDAFLRGQVDWMMRDGLRTEDSDLRFPR